MANDNPVSPTQDGHLDDPAWTEGFHFGKDEIEVTVRYRPDTWPDAVAFLAGVTGLGGEVLDVLR